MLERIRDGHVARWLGIVSLVGAPMLAGCEELAGEREDEEIAGEELELQREELALEREREELRGQQEALQNQQELQAEQGQLAQQAQQPQQPQPAQPGQLAQGQQGQLAQQGQPMPGHQMPQGQQWQEPQPMIPGQQAQPGQIPPAGQQQGQLAQQGAQPQPGSTVEGQRGRVRGTVQHVSVAKGSVTLDSNGQQITLRARPSDLAGLELGRSVVLPTVTYGDAQWVSAPGGEDAMAEAFGATAEVTGMIDSVDKIQGVISVEGNSYAAHPEQLQDVMPGQRVTLSYAQVQDARWVGEIQAGSGGPTAELQEEQLDEDELAFEMEDPAIADYDDTEALQ